MADDKLDELYHLELKPGYDPFERDHGRARDPIKRLRRLLKCAKDVGFVARWGRTLPAVALASPPESPDVLARCADGPAAGRRLVLTRAPLFLRVTFAPATLVWSGLDHLYHVPPPDDLVYVYRRLGEPTAAVLDWSERNQRHAELVELATYSAVSEIPDDATLRVSERWRDWCVKQVPKC